MKTYKEVKAELADRGVSAREAQEYADVKFNTNQLACDRCGKRPAKWTSGSYHFYWCDECHYD